MSLRNVMVGLVDYRAGNVRSIENALLNLGARVRYVASADQLEGITHILLPGVGAFGHCAEKLRATGLIPHLRRWAIDEERPMLGICVGMQLLADWGEEQGHHEGLGLVGGTVRAMTPQLPVVRVPHVGWNDVGFREDFGSFTAGSRADFYFDHSFAFHDPVHGAVLADCHHGTEFCAAVRRGKLIGAQFHPEKSQNAGQRFLRAFLELPPC